MGAVRTRTGRKRAVPWVVVGLWLAALVLVGPLAGTFADIQQNRAVDCLPDSADSTQAARIQDELPGGEATDLVLVYHRDGGLTDADRRTADQQITQVSGAHDLPGQPKGIPSKDGSTLMYPVSSTQPGQDEEARVAFVDGVRDIVEGGGGLSAEVDGPGALNTDMNKVFGTLDATLLLATLGVVTVLLILIYRSPFLWLVPLAVAGVAAAVSMAAGYGLHELFDVTVTGQSGGVMTVLVLGAGTDYALLIVSRYREELRRHERPYGAMRAALRAGRPRLLGDRRGRTPVPARRRPQQQQGHGAGRHGRGARRPGRHDHPAAGGPGAAGAAGLLAADPRLRQRAEGPAVAVRRDGHLGDPAGATVLVGGAVLLGALALGTLNLSGSLKQEDSFTERPESITAMRTLAQEYPERSSRPVTVIAPDERAETIADRARTTEGVAEVASGRSGSGWTEIAVFTTAAPVLREHGPPDVRGPLPGLDGLPDLAEAARLAGARVEQTVRIRQTPPAVGAAAYRMVQEALTNAVRHAGPEPAVHGELDERQGALHLSVRDDGTGPAPGGTPGFGLVGMRERARSVGGTLDAGPRTGGGFEVTAVLPLATTGEKTG